MKSKLVEDEKMLTVCCLLCKYRTEPGDQSLGRKGKKNLEKAFGKITLSVATCGLGVQPKPR